MNKRIEDLVMGLPQEYDGALIQSAVNRRYYTGVRASDGTLLITRNEAVLLVDFRYIEAAKATAQGCAVELVSNLGEQLAALCKQHGLRRLAVESSIPISGLLRLKAMLPQVELPLDNRLSNSISLQRSIKTKQEYQLLQAAQDIADKSFADLLNYIRVGVSEKSVATELAYITRKYGAQGESFETVAVSGKNTALPHGEPTDKRIEAGDLFTLDFGVMLEGYCSDMTRTVAVGAITEVKQRLYTTVLAAQLAALDALHVGVALRDVDTAARTLINHAGYEGCFGHGLGHALGMQVHEEPHFNTTAVGKLKPGMVLSVEPGIYLEGRFGCRIEDVIYVDSEKIINLTHSPKELIVL